MRAHANSHSIASHLADVTFMVPCSGQTGPALCGYSREAGGMFKICDEPESPNEGACVRYVCDELGPPHEGVCLTYMMNDERESAHEGACLSYIMMNRNRQRRAQM